MIKSTRIPPLNNIRFVSVNAAPGRLYHNFPFDEGWFTEQLRIYQDKTTYLQKIELTDRNVIYMDSLSGSLKWSLIDCNQKVIAGATATITPSVVLDGNDYVETDGISHQYNTFSWFFNASLYDVPAGVYYMLVEAIYVAEGDSDSEYYISEPLCFKADHPGTMLIECTNDTNDYDVLFEQLSPVFRLRFEGDVNNFLPVFNETVYEDQNYQLRKLQSVPYRNFTLTVGDNAGVPDYIIDKVNRALSCDKVKIEGVGYAKEKSTNYTMSVVGDQIYAMKAATMVLREYDHDSGWIFAKGDTTNLAHIPSFPAALSALSMGNGFETVTCSGTIVFDNSGEVNDLITILNTTIVNTYDLDGYFEFIDDEIVYHNAPDEYFHGDTSIEIYTSYISVGIKLPVVVGLTPHTFQYTFTNGRNITDWGSGNPVHYIASSGTLSPSHEYFGLTHTPYTVRIFHSGLTFVSPSHQMLKLFFNYTADLLVLSINAGSSVPGSLQWFICTDQNLAGNAVDGSFLNNAAANLQVVGFLSTGLSSFSTSLFTVPFASLEIINLTGNTLSATAIDTVVVNFGLGSTIIPAGAFLLAGQTPAAPPTGPALAYLGMLSSVYSWTISHD